ncbi:hypothetical protein A2701_01830 [Candidatus Amesbacteria bacterium RIFCSPHIGHO2_01_FULL_47_34]|nr:MAG: hypothetical protein A2701_01830 [Candidatus Amesbacteria bacterium RIFCSPHIGHO2_01_FULL_47_34]
MSKAEFEKELKEKLVEESKELAESPKEELLNELADVIESSRSTCSALRQAQCFSTRFVEVLTGMRCLH